MTTKTTTEDRSIVSYARGITQEWIDWLVEERIWDGPEVDLAAVQLGDGRVLLACLEEGSYSGMPHDPGTRQALLPELVGVWDPERGAVVSALPHEWHAWTDEVRRRVPGSCG